MLLCYGGSEGKEEGKQISKHKTFLHACTKVVILPEDDGENFLTCLHQLRLACGQTWMEMHCSAWNQLSMGSGNPSPALVQDIWERGPWPPVPVHGFEWRNAHKEDGFGDGSPTTLWSWCIRPAHSTASCQKPLIFYILSSNVDSL